MKKKKPVPTFSWENREQDLAKVIRYHKFKVMFYRTNLAVHSKRVPKIVQRLIPHIVKYYPNLDVQKALLISEFHDDYEMASKRGDIPLQLKLMMSDEEMSQVKLEEISAAEHLVSAYGNPTIEGHSYRDLLMHSVLKDCPEAQLHSFADKLDGYGEALHEALAGNTCFLEAVINYVANTFAHSKELWPLIADAFDAKSGPFFFPVVCLKEYFEDGLITSRPHTPTSLMRKAGIPHYEMWKEVTLELPNGMELLTQQLESHALHLVETSDPAPALAFNTQRVSA